MSALLVLGAITLAHAQQETAPTEEPTSEITLDGTTGTDAAMAARIREILDEIEGFEEVSVTVTSGVVSLRGSVRQAADIEALNRLVGRVRGVVTIQNSVTQTQDVAKRLTPAVDRFVARFTQAVGYLPLLAVAAVAFGAIVALGMALAALRWPWDRLAPNPFIADIYRLLVRFAFVLGAVVVAFDILGATALIGTILGAAGIVGLAIGFAVRDTVENLIASIMLSVRQPFRPNDFVEIDGASGNVVRLTSRATILLSRDGNHIRIPNATVFKSRIVNFTRKPERRFEFALGVDADADLAEARQVGLEALKGPDFVLKDPAPAAWIEQVGDSNVEIRYSGWIDQRRTDFLLARGEAIRIAKGALEHAGFGLPEPIYRLRFDPGQTPTAIADGPSPQAAASPRVVRPPEPAEADAAKDDTIERQVVAERQETPDDLLSRSAPQE